MSVETAPMPERSPTPTPMSLLVAVGALVASVGLVWAVGSATQRSPTASVVVSQSPAPAANARTNPTTGRAGGEAGSAQRFDRLNTPVGHHREYEVQNADLPRQTRAQLDVVRRIIARYPTAADAERDGWRRATTNLKGIAAHYLHGGVGGFLGIDATFAVNEPESLLYDGEGADAPIVGVSYLVSGPAPAGFYGKWDVWHNHQAVCFAGGYVIGELGGHADSEINMTPAQCQAQGGTQFPISNLNMLHVWMKPGFASSAGVFSHDHPQLR